MVDDLSWCALTVYLEAEGEAPEGKLAVAWVIANRSARWRESVQDVVFKAWQFSAWNTDSPRRLTLDRLDPDVYHECYRAACGALLRMLPDPTHGADHYLNVETVLRDAGRLPPWAAHPHDPTQVDPSKVTATIGRHTFLQVRA
jgi:hypothetical protein